MYTSALATSGVYLAAIFIFSAIAGCIGCVSCGCVNPLKTVYFFGDALFLVGVIWQIAVYSSQNVEVADADGILTSYLLVLAAFSTVLVVASGTLVMIERRVVRYLLVLCRVGAAALAAYTLYPGTVPETAISSAPAGPVLFMSIGVLLILITPVLNQK